MMHVQPIGLPGLAALALGFFLFFVALFAARRRALLVPAAGESGRSNASWGWVALQAVSIAMVGWGRFDVSLDPLSAKALAEGAVMLLLMLAAVGLFHASSRAMGKNWAVVARTRADHQLVQSGPFAYVRNPIYVALFLFAVAMATAYGHERQLIFAVPLYIVATWQRVRHEERLLRRQFGPAYDAYAARVKRFVPGVL